MVFFPFSDKPYTAPLPYPQITYPPPQLPTLCVFFCEKPAPVIVIVGGGGGGGFYFFIVRVFAPKEFQLVVFPSIFCNLPFISCQLMCFENFYL